MLCVCSPGGNSGPCDGPGWAVGAMLLASASAKRRLRDSCSTYNHFHSLLLHSHHPLHLTFHPVSLIIASIGLMALLLSPALGLGFHVAENSIG